MTGDVSGRGTVLVAVVLGVVLVVEEGAPVSDDLLWEVAGPFPLAADDEDVLEGIIFQC